MIRFDSTNVIPIESITEFCNAATDATPADLVAFAHGALFSPALSTLETALRKELMPPMPGLSVASLDANIHHPPSLQARATWIRHVRINAPPKSSHHQAPILTMIHFLNPSIRKRFVPNVSSRRSSSPLAKPTRINLESSSPHPAPATTICLFCMIMTATPSSRSPSRIVKDHPFLLPTKGFILNCVLLDYVHVFIALTMNALMHSKNSLLPKTWISSNLPHRTFIVVMLPNVPFAPSRIISLLVCVVWTRTFPFIYGTIFRRTIKILFLWQSRWRDRCPCATGALAHLLFPCTRAGGSCAAGGSKGSGWACI